MAAMFVNRSEQRHELPFPSTWVDSSLLV